MTSWDVRTACLSGDAQRLRELLACDAPCNDLDYDPEIGLVEGQLCWRPIHHAARNNHVECVSMLLDHHVDIDVTSDTGQTPLLIACESGAEHAVQFLLSRKASCRLADKCGQRPIHHAAAGANVRIVRMLLLADVDSVSLLDSDGWTPLHHAAAVGFVECVTLLVNEYKLDVHQREYGGWNALGLAVANNRLECVRCLLRLAGGAKRRCSRTTCARTDTAPALVNAMANDNYGCVYVASHRGHEQCLRLLIEHGADVNVLTNDTGEHPLDAAIAKSRTACIDILKPLTKPEYIYDE